MEEDFLGKVSVPSNAYYGAFTCRARNTFKLSGEKIYRELIYSIALIKKAAALANKELKRLDRKKADAIVKAADEILKGKFDEEFILDAFQAGAGTPMHMNVNEVIANRATEILKGKKGKYTIHPNNHVNMSQSSNNMTPTAIRIASLLLVKNLLKEMELLEKSLRKKAVKYKNIIKVGRTHLQDAVPITYGQVFDAYADAVKFDSKGLKNAVKALKYLGIGGNAIGTGITAHPKFRKTLVKHLRKTGLDVRTADNPIEKTQSMNDFLLFSGALRIYAITLDRIASDLRLLSSGPVTGLSEIILPAVEPGSSIMPGKINPSVPEAVNMVSYQVSGNDHVVSLAARGGQLELNVMSPVIGYNLVKSLKLLTNCSEMFRKKCIDGLEVNSHICEKYFNESFSYATALNPYLGYSAVSKLVVEAYKKKISLKKLILKKKLMSKNELDKILSRKKLTGPS